ncbi:MAG: hypothetical protein KKB31_00640 [Nanoarchaeota archaeon]|nr:hypothetical protein [Nanoarchaeota archaeon]
MYRNSLINKFGQEGLEEMLAQGHTVEELYRAHCSEGVFVPGTSEW